jgi:hypothetical protein
MVLRWYIVQCELRSLKYGALHNVPPEDHLHHILNFLAHIAQCTTWGRFAPYFKLLSSPCPLWHIRQGELRSLNMVQSVLSWYIGQGELRSLKYGSKRPQVIHWAMWAKKYKIWCKVLHHILNFLAHIAQCTNWGRFPPYLNFLAHLAQIVVLWAMWATKFKIWCKESSGGTLGNVS